MKHWHEHVFVCAVCGIALVATACSDDDVVPSTDAVGVEAGADDAGGDVSADATSGADGNKGVEVQCSNQLDDDNDGYIDCLDPDCFSTICRKATGDCDVAEACDGSSQGCPEDKYALPGGVCRASQGSCDMAEVCTGTSPDCPADVVLAKDTVCRGKAGPCDEVERCDGASGTCPADVKSSGAVCRAAAGICDQDETCDGTSASCPADKFKVNVICRAAAGQCDTIAEKCDGKSASCPPDVSTCKATEYCQSGSNKCIPKQTYGATCVDDKQCLSGHCSDNRCCDRACDGPCRACSTAGICKDHAIGTNPENGCKAFACDGKGACATSCSGPCDAVCPKYSYCKQTSTSSACVPTKIQGQTCSSKCECIAGNCVDGHCCLTACTGKCRGCATGICLNYVDRSDPDDDCGLYNCDGKGACYTGCFDALLQECSKKCKKAAFCNISLKCVPDAANGTQCLSHCACKSNYCKGLIFPVPGKCSIY